MMSEWQPIKTAPKDGRKILAWDKYSEYWIASWRLPMRGEPRNESHYVYEWRDGLGYWSTPTHWMELPPNPSQTPHTTPPKTK